MDNFQERLPDRNEHDARMSACRGADVTGLEK